MGAGIVSDEANERGERLLKATEAFILELWVAIPDDCPHYGVSAKIRDVMDPVLRRIGYTGPRFVIEKPE